MVVPLHGAWFCNFMELEQCQKLEWHSPGIVHKIIWIRYQKEPIEGSLGTKTLKGLLTTRTCATRTSICILRYASNHQVVSLFFIHMWFMRFPMSHAL